MPLVQVTMLKGRTIEQKRKLAARITDAMVEEAKAIREAVVITFIEISREDYANAGVLLAEEVALVDGLEEISAAVLHDRIQPADDILLEIGRVAVGFQRRGVFILLVEKKFARVFHRLVADIQQAARFLARMLLQDADVLAALSFGTGLHQHIDLENNHLAFAPFRVAPLSVGVMISASNSGRSIVWSRSGPVETMPIFAPLSRSIKRRYSWAFFGRSSKLAAPSVDFFHPGIFS